MDKICFECDAPATEEHHVIPESLGGTRTVPLCGPCHNRVHDGNWKRRDNHSELTKEGLRRAKARGVKLGNHTNSEYARNKGRESLIAKSDAFALKIYEIILPLKNQGWVLDKIAEYLNSENIATARGGKWHNKSVSNVWMRAKRLLEEKA
jgi:hypothetical protein